MMRPEKKKRKKKTPSGDHLYGVLPIEQALKHRRRNLHRLYLKKNYESSDRLKALQQLAQQQKVPWELVSVEELDRLCPDVTHQGVVLHCGPLPYVSESPLKQGGKPQVWMALDQVEDPQNIGAIIRSCGFFGVEGVIVPEAHFPGITPSMAKTSAGVSEWLPIMVVKNLSRFLVQQKTRQYWVIGLDMEASEPLTALTKDRSLILVMGNEGKGLRNLIRQQCDWMVHIAGNTEVASLNVSNAAAIAMYQVNGHLTS